MKENAVMKSKTFGYTCDNLELEMVCCWKALAFKGTIHMSLK